MKRPEQQGQLTERSPITNVISSVVNCPHCNPVISSYVTILLHHMLQYIVIYSSRVKIKHTHHVLKTAVFYYFVVVYSEPLIWFEW